MPSEKKIREVDTHEVNMRINDFEKQFLANDGRSPADDRQDKQRGPGQRTLAMALIVMVLVLLVVTFGFTVQSEPEITTMSGEVVGTTAPVSQAEPAQDNVPPTNSLEVKAEIFEVPIVVRNAEVADVEPELVVIEGLPETAEVSIVTSEAVDQTKVEMRTVETPEGVTENQFEGMEQTSPQPQPKLTTPAQPSIEHSVTVAVPSTPASSYASGILQAPTSLFEGSVQSYLPVTVPVLKQASWWQQLLFGLSPSSYVSGSTTFARGDVRYFVEIGSKSVHGETITLALVVPQVDEVQDAKTDDKTPLSEEEIKGLLIRDACLNVGNLRSVMNQTKVELAAEAGGYELLLSWYTHRGDHVAQNISDAELISYCQLG